ncbi:MAG: histidinol-phosphatase HisJ family protein [Bacillota bacterium]
MFDFHIHSNFSLDSKTPMEDIVLTAIKKNLRTICFTDHVDFEATEDKIDLLFRPLDYFRDTNRVKYKFRDKIEILAGVEIGMQPGLEERYNSFIEEFSFDFVIMSLHTINKKDIFHDYNSTELSSSEIVSHYYDELLHCVKSYDNFDVLGHIDFIDRYIDDPDLINKYDLYMDKIEKILKIVIDKGKGIELNTSGLRYRIEVSHPKPSILRLYRELGGDIITFGSDAHIAEHVGYEYRSSERMLRDMGFKYIYLFRNRKKYPIQIL